MTSGVMGAPINGVIRRYIWVSGVINPTFIGVITPPKTRRGPPSMLVLAKGQFVRLLLMFCPS